MSKGMFGALAVVLSGWLAVDLCQAQRPIGSSQPGTKGTPTSKGSGTKTKNPPGQNQGSGNQGGITFINPNSNTTRPLVGLTTYLGGGNTGWNINPSGPFTGPGFIGAFDPFNNPFSNPFSNNQMFWGVLGGQQQGLNPWGWQGAFMGGAGFGGGQAFGFR